MSKILRVDTVVRVIHDPDNNVYQDSSYSSNEHVIEKESKLTFQTRFYEEFIEDEDLVQGAARRMGEAVGDKIIKVWFGDEDEEEQPRPDWEV